MAFRHHHYHHCQKGQNVPLQFFVLNESEWVSVSLGEPQWVSMEWVVTAISHGYRKRVWLSIAYWSAFAYRSAIAYRGSAYGLKAISDWFFHFLNRTSFFLQLKNRFQNWHNNRCCSCNYFNDCLENNGRKWISKQL